MHNADELIPHLKHDRLVQLWKGFRRSKGGKRVLDL